MCMWPQPCAPTPVGMAHHQTQNSVCASASVPAYPLHFPQVGTIIPVEITVYEDRSFTFVLKTPPASVLLKKAAGVETGSGAPAGSGSHVA